jgi:hypothetical protein
MITVQISAASLNVRFSTAVPGKKDDIQERMREREREQKLRESEDKRIAELQKRMTEIAGNGELDAESKQIKLESLSKQIQQIHEARAEREKLAMEREVQKRQQEREEKNRELEKAGNANDAQPKDKEAALIREDISGMVKLAVSFDGIHRFKQVKANMAAEAEQLRQNIENDTGLMQIGLDVTIKTKGSHEFTNHFKNRNLAKLNQGIAALDDAINQEIGKLNRSTDEWVEDRLEINKQAEYEEKEMKAADDSGEGEVKTDANGESGEGGEGEVNATGENGEGGTGEVNATGENGEGRAGEVNATGEKAKAEQAK